MECRPKVVPKNKARKKVANPENWTQNKAKKRRLVANLIGLYNQEGC